MVDDIRAGGLSAVDGVRGKMGDGGERPGLGKLERGVVIFLLLGFVAFVVVLIVVRDNPHWDRLVYVFSGYEALVFAGAGALFGVQVKQREVVAGNARVAAAEGIAATAGKEAAAGHALWQSIESKLATRKSDSARRGARSDPRMPGVSEEEPTDLAELADLAARLFGRPGATE
jgi:hypothetical protein